jgi:fatty acid desaturase
MTKRIDLDNERVRPRETLFLRWFASVISTWIIILSSVYVLYAIFNYALFVNRSLSTVLLLVLSTVMVWFIVGNRQHALAVLGHEGGHELVLQNLRLNDLFTNLFAFYPLTASIEQFRKFHFAHHEFLSTSKDPEMIHKRRSAPDYDLPMVGKSSLVRLLFRDLCGLSYKELFVFITMIAPATFAQIGGIVAWWGVFISFAFFCNINFIFFFTAVWFISLGTTFWAFFRLRILTEHVGTKTVHRLRPTFFQRIVLFPYNIWCHYEHHAYPFTASPKLSHIRKTLDVDVKEDTMVELLESYKHMPHIPSGTPLAEVHIKGVS